MTTSTNERFKLGALELNDLTNFAIEDITFTVAPKKPVWASNTDADGEALVTESHYGPSLLELKVRVTPKSTVAAGIEKLGELTDAVQACEKVSGGQAIEWTPATTEHSYTGYVLSGEVSGVPVEATGDGAGWLLGAPVITIKLTCKPFWYAAERTIKSVVESGAEPLQVVYVPGVKGDVPGEARLIVKDAATPVGDRRYAAWGRDNVLSETNPTLLLTAKSGLTGTNFSGESKTRSGAYSEEKVLRGVAVSQATTICGTGRIENVGTYAIYLRVYATSEAARFRIAYKNGDGATVSLAWKEPTVVNGWSEIFMGTVTLDAVTLGTQTSEIRVQQRASEANPSNDVNFLMLWPSKAAAYGNGPASNEPTNLLAYDSFEHAGGASGILEGTSLALGGSWAMVNKTGTNGFLVNETLKDAFRAKTGDSTALGQGCYGLAGTTSYGTAVVGAEFVQPIFSTEGNFFGLLLRYASTEKWLLATLTQSTTVSFVQMWKNVSGTLTNLGSYQIAPTSGWSLVAGAFANGSWWVSFQGQTVLRGYDAVLAAGGSLETGRIGVYDQWRGSTACTRTFDFFAAYGAELPGRVLYSGKQMEFNSQGALRQDSTGTYDGQPSGYRGGEFYLDPAGSLGIINRVAVRTRRNDNEAEEDLGVTDKQRVEVLVKERFLLPR